MTLKELKEETRGALLGVDFGDSRTGLAVCDATRFIASGRENIVEKGIEKTADRVAEYALREGVSGIVVGLPKNMDGSLGWRAEECSEIAEKIKAVSNIETVLWDERCTTVSAHTALNFTETRGKKRKNVVDAVAAVIILEDYLAYRKNKNLRSGRNV